MEFESNLSPTINSNLISNRNSNKYKYENEVVRAVENSNNNNSNISITSSMPSLSQIQYDDDQSLPMSLRSQSRYVIGINKYDIYYIYIIGINKNIYYSY